MLQCSRKHSARLINLFSTRSPQRLAFSEFASGIKRPSGTIFHSYDSVGPDDAVKRLMEVAQNHDPHQLEWLQAVSEIVVDLVPVFEREKKYISVVRHIMEPERLIKFRVPWIDDHGNNRVNRGYRVQYSSVLGPYKGGIRFHPSVSESVLKFLGFEQVFKNALTGLPLGGAYGGANFDPKGKSVAEILRFCQSFITELHHYLGARRDVPAGDIGCGRREIGFMFGHYKRMTSDFSGVLTGKGVGWGGANIRKEANGYGTVYFASEALMARGIQLEGKRCALSGSGNVALFCAEKLLHFGAKPVTLSDSNGVIYKPDGFTQKDIDTLKVIKENRDARVGEILNYSKQIEYIEGKLPWYFDDLHLAFPCATENEVNAESARALVATKCLGLFEGANMPSTPEAVMEISDHMIYGPGKATNAGGVSVSGLEMAQNAQMTTWMREQVDDRLQGIMRTIYQQCAEAAREFGSPGNLKAGANIASFLRVANALLDQGQ